MDCEIRSYTKLIFLGIIFTKPYEWETIFNQRMYINMTFLVQFSGSLGIIPGRFPKSWGYP